MHLYVAGGTGVGKSKFLEHLVRQDIFNWRDSHAGLLVVDPHGSLYDNVLAWLAKHNLKRPIIPIDLRKDDWIVAYNLLRNRKVAKASVVVDSIIDAMTYVWGANSTNPTPLFARWAGNVLTALYEKQRTLADAIPLLDDPNIRRHITKDLKDRLSKRDWKLAAEMRRGEFENQVASTINRLPRFIRNENFEAMFGQGDISLDLGEALEKGHIVLVSLAREGAKVSQENTRLFATLLLNDLWTAAQERGKPRDAKDIRPFYVYLDEFQRFVTPTISENLDEARGFGLHLTMAHQFPKQLRDEGDNGRRLYNSVMENTLTKVVFRLTDRENLEPLAQWLFMGTMDPEQVKHELYSTKVMNYREEERQSYSRGRSTTQGSSAGGSTAHAQGSSVGGTSGSSSGASYLEPDPNVIQFFPDDPRRTISSSESSARSDSLSETSSESSSWSDIWAETESESVTTSTVLIPELGKELSHVQFRSIEEQLHIAMMTLFDQKQRYGVVRIADRMKAPVSIRTPDVPPAPVNPKKVEDYVKEAYKKWPFFLPMTEAIKKLAMREKLLIAEYEKLIFNDEPASARRRIR